MSEPRRCPQCDAEIPANSPIGLCPRCLLKAGTDSQSAAEPGPTKITPPASCFVPPTVEELAPLFPKLEILELLGKGGMGAVYKARQPGLDRLVAVKILPPEISHDPSFAERFQREARALARLSHPHIVAVYDFGVARPESSKGVGKANDSVSTPFDDSGRATQGSLCYIVMEFVDGANLRQTIKAGKLAPAEALAIVPQICEALQFAHDEGIVHRDIKPENILIDKRGRVKIADFGLAKLLGTDASDHSLTATHQVMGTLRYMAPEQMQGSREVDHRADIYSLGVVFYELLTGELPMGRFAPPSKRVQVDVRLDEVVLRALEQDPEQRYQHASDVKSELDTISRTPPPAGVARPESAKGVESGHAATATSFMDSGRATPPAGEVADKSKLVQGPADCLLLAAGMTLATACGVAVWLMATRSNNLAPALVRHNLTVASITHLVYSLGIGVAGLMLRQLRARLAVLLTVVIVGLFIPAVVAVNVIMELRNIPDWPVAIPLWLGIPAALWAVVRLFRDDVRRTFVDAAQQRLQGFKIRWQQSLNPDRPPRFSGFAIAGAVWALFGLLAVIPTLYFIGLNRVWNGEALPTDVIHSEPPLVFSIFMGALLAIGAGAPIGTTIFGSFAIGHIKRSEGKIVGLPLAVADAIFFPLLALFVGFAFLVAQTIVSMTHWKLPAAEAPAALVSLVVCFFVARAVWRAIAGRSAQPQTTARTNVATPSVETIATETRLSRCALVGAIWAPMFFIAFLASSVGMQSRSYAPGEYTGPAGWQLALMFTLLPLGVLAPFGTTILGAVAIGKIKRSEGKLYGLRLAQADALLFPLLVLFMLAFLGGFLLVRGPMRALPPASGLDEWFYQSPRQELVALLIALPIWFFPARALWRAVVGPNDAFDLRRLPLVGAEPLTGKASLVVAMVAIAAHAWPWHWIIMPPPASRSLTISNFDVIDALQSFWLLVLSTGLSLFASAGSLAKPAKIILRIASIAAAIVALVIQVQFFRSLGEFEPGQPTVVRLTRTYSHTAVYVAMTLTGLAILFFLLRLFENNTKRQDSSTSTPRNDAQSDRVSSRSENLPSTAQEAAQAQESLPYLLGWLVHWLLQERWFVATLQTATVLIYAACLIAFFSFQSTSTQTSKGLLTRFQVGQPSAWLTLEASPSGQHASFEFLTLTHFVALFGLISLAVYRWLERRQSGKAHSMNLHYFFWGMFLAGSVGFGLFTLSGSPSYQRKLTSQAALLDLPPLGTITSGIGAEFTVPAGHVATFEIVTRRDSETVAIPSHCAYVMAPPDRPEPGVFRWTPIAKDGGAGSHRNYRIEMRITGDGGGHSEATLLPDELNTAVGARGLSLGVLEPNEEAIHWGTADVKNLPANGLIGLRVTVVPHGLTAGGSGTGHIDWKRSRSTESTSRRKLP